MTFDVPLATCASSLERTTSVRLEFSPTVSIFETVCPLASSPTVFNFETVCHWAGPLQKFETDLCTGVRFLFVVAAATSTPLLLGFQKTTRFVHLLRLVLALSSGIPVFTTLRWKGVSFPLGLEIRLISLLWAFLHCSLRRLLRVHLLCAPSMRHGKLAHILGLCWRTLLFLVTFLLSSMVPLFFHLLARLCGPCGRYHRLALLLAVLLSFHCVRVRVFPHVWKGTWSVCGRGSIGVLLLVPSRWRHRTIAAVSFWTHVHVIAHACGG